MDPSAAMAIAEAAGLAAVADEARDRLRQVVSALEAVR